MSGTALASQVQWLLLCRVSIFFIGQQVMLVWKASATTPSDVARVGLKSGPKQKLPLMAQFFLVTFMSGLERGWHCRPLFTPPQFPDFHHLDQFDVLQLPVWLSRRAINHPVPPCFKQWLPTTRVTIGCTEFFVNTPSPLATQSATWSAYKSHNTVACLIGIVPHGHVTFCVISVWGLHFRSCDHRTEGSAGKIYFFYFLLIYVNFSSRCQSLLHTPTSGIWLLIFCRFVCSLCSPTWSCSTEAVVLLQRWFCLHLFPFRVT